MASPFDDEDGDFVVLANDQRQHCLWPASVPVPRGWGVVFEAAGRAACLDYVERNWTETRPV